MRTLPAAASLVTVALALTACTATPSLLVEVTETPTPEPTAESIAEATQAPEDPAAHSCAGAEPLQVRPDDDEDRLHMFGAVPVIDSGERRNANGTTTFDGDKASSYEVAPGDTLGAIAERFCTTSQWIQYLNVVRRATNYSNAKDDWTLYAGDTLNLDPYTIESVGDQNGVAYEYKPVIHLPPQQ